MRSRLGFVLAIALPLLASDCPDDGVVAPTPPTGDVTGVVTIDGEAAAGITVTLSNGLTAVTDASGVYTFTDVQAGAYTVAISGYPADVTFETTARALVIASHGQVVTADFAGARTATASITGSVTAGDVGLAGVSVSVSGPTSGTSTTDGHGQYAVNGLKAGSYTVSISGFDSNSYDFLPTAQSTSLGAGETRVIDFTGTEAKTASLGVQVNIDESGASGVAVGISGPASGTATTDGHGSAAFSDLPRGEYSVSITNPDPDNVVFDATTKTVTIANIGGSGAVTFVGTTKKTALDVALTPTSISATHQVGVTSCPQDVGTFTLTNQGSEAVAFTISAGSAPLTTAPSTGSLGVGESVTVKVSFTCAQSTSFTGTLEIGSSVPSGASRTDKVEVTVTIS